MGGENELLDQGENPPQQPWNTDHEAKVTMMATEGARVWSLSLNMFMGFSTVCPRESECHEMDRSAPAMFDLGQVLVRPISTWANCT